MPEWGPTVFLSDGGFEPDAAQREALAQRGVDIVRERITRIVERATVELADGRRLAFDGLFMMNRFRLSSPVAEQLGCVIEEGPLGPYVRTDDAMETSAPGVFACGDITQRAAPWRWPSATARWRASPRIANWCSDKTRATADFFLLLLENDS